MQATLIAAGSRGDVQPYIALGAGLKRAGHAVRVLASPDFRELITSHDLTFFDMGGSIQSVAQGMEGLLEGGNLLKIMASMGPAAERLVSEAVVSGIAACQGSDVIIAGLGGLFVGQAISEKLGIGFVPAYLYPFTPTRAFGSVLSPLPLTRLPGWAIRLSHRMAQQMMWQTFRAADTKARRQVLRIPAASFWGPYASLERADRLILCGYSPQVIPVPSDWGSSIHVTGYWFLDPSPEWQPPADLVDFIESGPPPVYIGFGSMINRRPRRSQSLCCARSIRPASAPSCPRGGVGLQEGDCPRRCSWLVLSRTPGCSRRWRPWCIMAASERRRRACEPASRPSRSHTSAINPSGDSASPRWASARGQSRGPS